MVFWFSWCWAFFFIIFVLEFLECHKYYLCSGTSNGLLELTKSESSVSCCCAVSSLVAPAKHVFLFNFLRYVSVHAHRFYS